MKEKLESEEYDRDGVQDLQENGANSRREARGQYLDRKKKKKPTIGNRLADQGKTSTYSSSSRLTSLLKGQSMSEAENFKVTQSVYFNQLAQKYVPRGAPPQKIRQEMQLALQRKRSEIQALRVHRDELKFISYNNPYDMPIKMSLAVLKEKARTEQKIKDMTLLLQKDIKQIDFEFETMTNYYNFISNALKTNGEDDLIIDTQEEEKLMIQNLEKETNHLFRQLKEQDKKNAKQIKNMQQEIALLRIYIKQKQDKIRDLKSKICTLHIKLHSRGSNSKEKNLSLSIRKFITEKNNAIQQAFVGNNSFKHYSKQLLQKVTGGEELVKLMFYYDIRKQLLTFKCIYKHAEGKLHTLIQEPFVVNNIQNSPNKAKTQKITQIKVKYLLSIKFYFKSKIVGVECRIKSQKGTQHIQIGNCSTNLQHELLTLINKRIVTLGSYWHQKDMIGVGLWYCSKQLTKNTSTDSKDSSKQGLKTVRSAQGLKQEKQQYFNEYYNT